MQVTLETTEGLERKMRIHVPADQLERKVDEKLKEAAQRARLKGFRPGKVPMREVKRRFEPGIRQEVSSELVQQSFNDAVQQESVVPAGPPKIDDIVMLPGKDLEYTALFEVFPEVKPGDSSEVVIEQPISEVTEADLEMMIEKLREQRAEYNEVERKAIKGDKLNIDFEGFIDDEPFDGNKAEGSDLVIGSGSMIPGFEDGLVGCVAGDGKDLEVSFPDDYHVDDLAGKPAIFKVVVNSISESVKPDLDENFFKQFGIEEDGLEAFKIKVRDNMDKELVQAIKQRVTNQVMDGLISVTEVDVPKALVEREVERMRNETVQRYGGNNKIDPSLLPAEMFESQASRRVKLGLIINALVEQESIEVDDDRVTKAIENMASAYEDPKQVIEFYSKDEQQQNQIRAMVLEEQVVDLLLERSNIEEKNMSYEDVLKPLQPDEETTAD
ncbi:MAG: trigger factor [Gammaproteobacteria bacterium]|nr:trigger factor [Gammaproteobacteria bacterium]OUV67912.1 MAG: trigger factor [Gammaproteobacteria bacterium TMED133]